MSTVNEATIQPGYEPIPGYRLQEPIGSGGFGEVWRAEAPGGMHKAIKFVHGALNERQATRELRSLERIKGVHHPFLLTLERFEVVGGRLIIVTELADGSLEDVYRRHRDRGSCGIPRAALLAYLHDAADALDYLNQRYQLQHLDVKPGNLLMVGGHVKVADFGLLKDLRDVDCSMIGGLTPIYAPPEVFDGRPSPASDQYSLAVMYQELLTGTRPFTGRTIAQLATQHVHSAPNLDPLPASDRPVIARSLEKNPDRRFSSCLELIEALRSAADRSARVRCRAESGSVESGDTWDGGGDTRTSTSFVPGTGTQVSAVKDLPCLSADQPVPQATSTAHALLVAVGGTGAECLHRLRERVAEKHAACPLDLHSVLIDTAPETIHAARLGEVSDRVHPCTPIWIPLRTPSEYRDGGGKHLASVSRRWLYNVPRSGRTEGLRPLGRLALVDHGAEVLRKLGEAVQHLAAVAGNSTPRVYLVGSLGGGTASGTVWDLAHLLRHLLDEQGLPQASVTPLLTAPAMESARQPLSVADCHAALSEMHHYLLPGNSYPGDAGPGWPGVPAARSPLNDAYIVADPAGSAEAPRPVEMISDYIWADAAVAGPLLQAARDAAPTESAGTASKFEPVLRSLGITPLRSDEQLERPRLARAVASRMLRDWLGRPAEARVLAAQLHGRLAHRCGLDADSLAARCASPPQPPASVTTLASREPCGDADPIDGLRRQLAARLQHRRIDMATCLECISRITDSLRVSATSPPSSAPPATWESLLGGLAEQLGALTESLTDHAAQMAAAIQQLGEPSGSSSEPPWAIFPESIRDRIDQALDAVHSSVSPSLLAAPVANNACNLEGTAIATSATAAAMQVVEMLLGPSGPGASDACRDETDAAETITSQTTADWGRPQARARSIADSVRSIRPALLACGGQQRLLLLVGSEAERVALQSQVADAHGGTLSVVVVPGIAPLLVHEAQRIPLAAVLGRFAATLGGTPQISARLQTRSDIRWNTSDH